MQFVARSPCKSVFPTTVRTAKFIADTSHAHGPKCGVPLRLSSRGIYVFRETRSMSSIVYDFPLSHECATENSVTLFSFAQHRSNSCSLSLSFSVSIAVCSLSVCPGKRRSGFRGRFIFKFTADAARDQYLPHDDAPLSVDGRRPSPIIISPGVNRTVGVALISVHRAREDAPRTSRTRGTNCLMFARCSPPVVVLLMRNWFVVVVVVVCLARTEVTRGRWLTATRYRSRDLGRSVVS